MKILKEKGYQPIAWTRGIWDTDRPGVALLYKRATENVQNGDIFLLHDGCAGEESPCDRSQTVQLLRPFLESLLAQGFQFVPLEKMIRP